ncbi:MAG: hypothetical protein KF889_11160 [Alphaproteobacteria bacterium]|nr:hypothetical protein [Alphaproteobacteria bacterium]MCW5743418.1 hypothetical protein [Alphaproteobacteria bacterium]
MSLVTTALSSAFTLAGLPRTLALYGVAVAAVVARRIALRLARYVAIALVVAVGMAFLTAAIFLALLNALGAVYAALIVGSAYLVTGLVALIVMRSARP